MLYILVMLVNFEVLIFVSGCLTRYAESAERMTVEELEKGKEWLNDTFHLIR